MCTRTESLHWTSVSLAWVSTSIITTQRRSVFWCKLALCHFCYPLTISLGNSEWTSHHLTLSALKGSYLSLWTCDLIAANVNTGFTDSASNACFSRIQICRYTSPPPKTQHNPTNYAHQNLMVLDLYPMGKWDWVLTQVHISSTWQI